jgi:hypothetical protein
LRSRYWGTQNLKPQRLDGTVQLLRVDAVSIMDQPFVPTILIDRFSQLLQRPLDSGMRRHVDVRQSPISMLDEHEHVEYPERHGHRHEEIAGDDGPGVISQERRPALIAARPAW